MQLFVGLPGFVNDQRVLQRLSLWHHVMQRGFLNIAAGLQDGFLLYLLADKGYPLLSWIMTSFKEDGQPRSLAENLYNRRYWRDRSVVENTFGLMKENWREMLNKSTLEVAFVPDVVHAYCILHNLTIWKGSLDIDALLHHVG